MYQDYCLSQIGCHAKTKMLPLAPSVEIGTCPGQQIPMEIPGYRGSLLLVLKYSNMSSLIEPLIVTHIHIKFF